MIPEFLKAYEQEMFQQKLDTIRVKATPVLQAQSLPIKQSKFLGKPYLPVGQSYPKSRNGKPMIMLAQINFEETPLLENYPSKGILQLFVPALDLYGMEEFAVIFHEDAEQECYTDFSFLSEELYQESPIAREHSLAFIKDIEYGGMSDFRFNMSFNGMSYGDFEETLTEAQQEEMSKLFDGTGHKIGGYAYFTQSDPRDYDEKLKNDVLLFQIDTDDEIMFGDSGVAHVFLNLEDLKNQNFEKAYFNWDCF
ncbi:MAG: DUF1963 domain-containing protein [Bacteroidia bacterium]|nr:DUF1963 domain-containing protein [Bacteroidia bacterium]